MLNHTKELIISALFILLALALTDPLDNFMPTNTQMGLLAFFLLAYAVFAGLLFREKAMDEREEKHLHISSRIAFFAGTFTLISGIAIQALQHTLDSWLVWALTTMVVAKTASLYWVRKTQ